MAKSDGQGGGGRGRRGKVDLNTASREELMELDGVGERTVERLLQAREQMGGFESMEALARIDGIGESTVRRLGEVLEVRGGSGGGRSGQSRGGAQSKGRGSRGGGQEQDGMMVQQARELFLHELSDIYSGEQLVAQMLPMLADEVADTGVRTAFREHERETQQQIKNLDRCFQVLGETPQRMTCRPVEGLRQEHDGFVRERPSEQLMTMFALGAEAKTEGFEIASYRALVNMAGVMGEEECARLLQENLRQEEQMAERVERLSRDMGRQMQQAMR